MSKEKETKKERDSKATIIIKNDTEGAVPTVEFDGKDAPVVAKLFEYLQRLEYERGLRDGSTSTPDGLRNAARVVFVDGKTGLPREKYAVGEEAKSLAGFVTRIACSETSQRVVIETTDNQFVFIGQPFIARYPKK